MLTRDITTLFRAASPSSSGGRAAVSRLGSGSRSVVRLPALALRGRLGDGHVPTDLPTTRDGMGYGVAWYRG